MNEESKKDKKGKKETLKRKDERKTKMQIQYLTFTEIKRS